MDLEVFISQNAVAFYVSTLIMVLWVEVVKYFARFGLLQPWHRRKLLHVVTGPIYILTWPLFTNSFEGALFASAVPLVMTAKFFLIGIGALVDSDTVKSASRNGDKKELLRGPLLYGIIFVLSTLLFWKQSRGIISLFILCFGDGFAEIAGRRFGARNKLPWSRQKSFAGVMGFFTSSVLFTCLFLYFCGDNVINKDTDTVWATSSSAIYSPTIVGRVLFVAVVAGAVESLPLQEVDNVTIFIAGVAADMFFCRQIQ